jgi:hypothetical protein
MLKQLLKYLLLWLLPLFVSANFVNWLGNYNAAHQKALKKHKPLLVLVVKKKDPLSSEIIKNSFMNTSYVNEINKNMVPVIVTYEGALSYPIEMYYTTIFPTLFFVDSSKETFLREPLYGERITKEEIQKLLQ